MYIYILYFTSLVRLYVVISARCLWRTGNCTWGEPAVDSNGRAAGGPDGFNGFGPKNIKKPGVFGKIRLRTSTDGPTILFWSAGAGHRNIVKTQFLLTSLWIRSLPMIFHSWESTCFDHVNDQWTIWRDLSCFVSSLGDWLAGSGEGNEEVHIKLCRGWWPQSVYGCWNGFMIRSHWRVPLQ